MPRYDDLDPTRSTPQAAAVVPADVDALTRSLETLRRDLLFARILGLVAVCVSLLLAGLVYQLSSRMQSTEREVRAIAPAIAQAADQKLSQLAPQLDARLGRFEEAFEWLNRAYARRDTTLLSLATSPVLKPLRGDPRFAALARRLHFPSY